MIRPTEPRDTDALVELARGTGVFKPAEVEALREVLDDYHAKEHAQGHLAVTSEREGRPVGFAYYAPSAMSEHGWYLWWIAVDATTHARGLGSELLRHAEGEVRRAGGRILLIETSSLPRYELTRRFYLKHEYDVAGTVRDFYADGDDLVVFSKRLQPEDAGPGTVTS
jgi:GNAT superfamily N-acetyltransferase